MVNRSAEFASLLCSRLCHDLLSPVGALNNGIELLADETDPEMRASCMELLANSATAAANKLKFFRLAFGAAGGFAEMVDAREALAAIEGLHGTECSTCAKEAFYAYRLTKAGKSPAQIRAGIAQHDYESIVLEQQ